jgi:2-amino-4-hydroxy-6-hydroxymethyldihydropteridine diphosphokinase
MSSDPTTTPVAPEVERQVDSADVTLHNPSRAVIALGSNLGNRLETLQGAVDALEDTPGVRIKAVSAVYETEGVGWPEGQPAFLNAVLVLRTTLPPHSLLERANAVEDAFGRVREVRWGPRTLDVDILTYEGVFLDRP